MLDDSRRSLVYEAPAVSGIQLVGETGKDEGWGNATSARLNEDGGGIGDSIMACRWLEGFAASTEDVTVPGNPLALCSGCVRWPMKDVISTCVPEEFILFLAITGGSKVPLAFVDTDSWLFVCPNTGIGGTGSGVQSSLAFGSPGGVIVATLPLLVVDSPAFERPKGGSGKLLKEKTLLCDDARLGSLSESTSEIRVCERRCVSAILDASEGSVEKSLSAAIDLSSSSC